MLRFFICMVSMAAAMASAQEGVSPAGKVVDLTTAYGTQFDAYLAGPEEAPRAVLLLHDRYGLNDQVRDWADRFAKLGYRALAIDLYDGRHGKSWKHATTIMHAVDQVWADSDVAAALDFLKDKHPERKIVVLGWDYGGTQALLATLHEASTVAATIIYYPTHLETSVETVQTIDSPVMIVVAERDEELLTKRMLAKKGGLTKTRVDFYAMGLDALSNIQGILAVLRTRTDINVVGMDADRGFSDPLSEHYDAGATATVWDETQAFLARYVTP